MPTAEVDRQGGLLRLGEEERRATFKTLGHSSAKLPKRHLLVKLDEPWAPLGMPASRRWVLHGPAADKTLLRNVLAYDWARRLGMPAPRTRFVELTLDDDPVGLYLLMEFIEPHPDKVALSRRGLLFRRDKVDPDDSVVRSARGETFVIDAPPDLSAAEREALHASLSHFEARLFAGAPWSELSKLADLQSFVDHALLVEVTKNADGFKWSTYFHQEPNGPLRSGPPFDYDAALGNDRVAIDPTGWQHRYARPERSPWVPELWKRPEFLRAFLQRYDEVRGSFLETAAVRKQIDALADEIAEARVRNFERWPFLRQRLLTNPDALGTYPAELARLKSWLALRLEWLDAQLHPPALKQRVHEQPSRQVRCGIPIELPAPPRGATMWVETVAPPSHHFELLLDGTLTGEQPSLPIRSPRRELGSAVDAQGQLHLGFLRPAGKLELVARGPCRLPAVRVFAAE